MAWQVDRDDIVSMLPAAALAARLVVRLSAANTVAAPSAADTLGFGVTYSAATAADATNGNPISVAIGGLVEVTASAAISAGALLAIAGTSGKVKAITPADGATARYVIGQAVTAAAADNDIITAHFFKQAFVGA
jgi:hypothetical protein